MEQYLPIHEELLSFKSHSKLQEDLEVLDEGFKNLMPHHEEEKHKHKHEVFHMLQKAYKDQGGIHGTGFKSPDDMVKHIPMWKLGHKNGKIHSVSMYKDSGSGRKRVAMATDGSEEGKKSASEVMHHDLKQKRAHMEVSGKSLSFMKKHTDIKQHLHSFDSAKAYHEKNGDKISKPAHDDPEVLRHPELKDHMYTRKIGDHIHTKVLLGTVGKHIK